MKFKANTESIKHHPKDLKLFLGEHQFFGIKKLIIDYFFMASKYFLTFSTHKTYQWIKFKMQKKNFELLLSSLQESLVIFANLPKKTILEKSKNKPKF
jgi:hypothetical protein